MSKTEIPLTKVSFKSAQAGSYKKEIGQQKDTLRNIGFPTQATKDFILFNLSDKKLEKIRKNTPENTILVSLPSKKGDKAQNILPREYAKILSDKTGYKHVDLNNYLDVRQAKSARSSYSSKERAQNYFNISFKDEKHKNKLGNIIENKSILLVDDVITTGETLVAMATILKHSFPKLNIVGGNALFAVDTRTPTTRDIYRLTQKLSDNLSPDISSHSIEKLVQMGLSKFTRKKMMRFELGTKTKEDALSQFENLKSDINKMQTSIKESIEGNLLRYPLSAAEIKKVKDSPAMYLSEQLKSRTIMHYYPNAIITTSKDGKFQLFADDSRSKELSKKPGTFFSQKAARTSAVDFIRENIQKQSQDLNTSKNKTISR